MIVKITESGDLEYIYKDHHPLSALEGNHDTTRASHVEPNGMLWQADLSPVGGPVLDATKTREESLNQEIVWLENKLLS